MPTYQNKCFDCNYEFEVVQKITEDSIKICPKCQGNKVQRLLYASPFQLKGSGWYQTDYAGKKSGSNGSSSESSSSDKSSSSAAAETKSDTKSESQTTTAADSNATSSATPKSSTPNNTEK